MATAKVGTAVVTRSDGRLAVGRIGSLCEQVKELIAEGTKVILVTSGAIGVGRQKLRYQRLMNSSFGDLQEPELELDGKACAAFGQSGLMALYDSLLTQLDVQSSQILVTDRDFSDEDFRKQLSRTVDILLASRVVPIFNENDAISTRKAPYEDSTGIFWDNESLAGLLAVELRADLLILLSYVEGLYSGPPGDPASKLIHTYLREKHVDTITFGEKSRVGMTAKVLAAWTAASAGVPVVITSGFTADGILRVMTGERIGTLFHKDAHLWVSKKEASTCQMAVMAREASPRLQTLTMSKRRKILLDIADALEADDELIQHENNIDVQAAQGSGVAKSLVARSTLNPGKVENLVKSVRILADMEEPVGKIFKRFEISDGLILEKTTCSLGVLLVVFESRPDALVQEEEDEQAEQEDGQQEKGGLSESGLELKKLLGKSAGLDESGEEESSDDDNYLDNEDNSSPVLAPKSREGPKEELVDSTPSKVSNAAPGRTASGGVAASEGKRKAGADDSKPSVPTSSKRVKAESSQEDGKLAKDSAAIGFSSTKGSSSRTKANGAPPKAKPSLQVTEEDVKAFLKQAGPVKTYDLVNKFKNRLFINENKQAFAAMLKNITRIHKTDAGNFIVLREK